MELQQKQEYYLQLLLLEGLSELQRADPELVDLAREDPGLVGLVLEDLAQEDLELVGLARADPALGVGWHLLHQRRTKTPQEHTLPIKGRK